MIITHPRRINAGPDSPPTLREALWRKFFTARVPGSIATPLVVDPAVATDAAVEIAEAFIDQARTEERQRCAAELREHAARLVTEPDTGGNLLRAAVIGHAADLLEL